MNLALLKPKQAVVTTLFALSIVLSFQDVFVELSDKMNFLVTVCATTYFGYVGAKQNHEQQNLLMKLARTDPLTGARNRRAFNEELAIAMSDFQRKQTPQALIVFDIDHFKKVNDNYGHESGDRTLIELTKLVEQHTRMSDRLFRLGGEEFAILVGNLSENETLLLAEKIRKTVETSTINPQQCVTISLGLAFIRHSDDTKSWQKRADNALYTAKNLGRNRCEIEESDELSTLEKETDSVEGINQLHD